MDSREPDSICDNLEGLGAEIEVRALSLGDYQVSDRLLIERKTRADFEASILDGRLFSQVAALAGSVERTVILIEGEPDYKSRISRAALLGAYASLISDFGCALFFTKSPSATAEMIHALACHEQVSKGRLISVYVKRKARSFSDSQLAVVEALPNVGPTLARALLSYFDTIENIATAPVSELVLVGKIGQKKAENLRKVLSTRYKPEEKEGKKTDEKVSPDGSRADKKTENEEKKEE